MRSLAKIIGLLAWLVVVPAAAYAQGTIAGTVADASGAVLPGVTVEVASPALIEKVRSVVTDGTGQYKVVDLRPGLYTVTYTLAGFNTVKREGIELSGNFVATVNAEMKVGAVEETITVTGETPIVDVQSTALERVMDAKVINDIPSNRNHYAVTVLIPGVTVTAQDVGGAAGNSQGATMSAHGSHGDDMRVSQSGISLGTLVTGGAKSSNTYNLGAMQEVAVDTGAASAEFAEGGVRIALIPKDGGNTFSGIVFANFANHTMQASNYSQALKDAGLSTPGGLDKVWSFTPGFGGPVKKDKVWFYFSYANNGADDLVPGMFYNQNFNKLNVWTYAPDTSRPAILSTTWGNVNGRLTWQATPKNKIGVWYDHNLQCNCIGGVSATTAPEAGTTTYQPGTNILVDWTAPVTNRVLFEATVAHRSEFLPRYDAPDVDTNMISVTDQVSGLTYRNRVSGTIQDNHFYYYRAALSYVTGAHAFKAGFINGWQTLVTTTSADQPVSFRISTATGVPVPNLITLQALPYTTTGKFVNDGGIFAQDKWTIRRMTLAFGFRYDHVGTEFPQQFVGAGPLTPTRNLTIPETTGISWNDLTPKFGVSYDLFGNGKTALKATANKFVAAQGLSGAFGSALNPVSRLIQSTTRSWTDRNGNFVPDCDLTNPAAQTVTGGDICGAMANANFGSAVPGSTYDPNTLTGWGKRGYDWEFSGAVQHEIVPRLSVTVSYFRRIFGNFFVTDNLAVNASDYSSFSVPAPVDARLPNGGGYTVPGVFDLNPAKFGVPTNNFVTFADTYGNQTEHWNGVDVSANARLRNGLLLQGGTSTGRSSTNSCQIQAAVPETAPLNPYCNVESPIQTQVKALASYTLPKIGVEVSGTFQSIPGGIITGNFVATNALVAPSLGRSLSGGAANATVNIVAPWSLLGDRLNQMDFRVGKVLRYGKTRSSIRLDVYNMLNAATVLTRNASYGAFLQPTTILQARFAKIGYQLEF